MEVMRIALPFAASPWFGTERVGGVVDLALGVVSLNGAVLVARRRLGLLLGLLLVEVVPIAVAFAARPRFRMARIGDIVDLALGVVLAASGPLEAGAADVERFEKAEVRFWTSEDGSRPSREVNVGRGC